MMDDGGSHTVGRRPSLYSLQQHIMVYQSVQCPFFERNSSAQHGRLNFITATTNRA